MFAGTEELGQDAPGRLNHWESLMEATSAAGLRQRESFSSKPGCPWRIEQITVDPSICGPKYLEFTRRLVELGKGRFTVGMPIMRGPSDMVGAIMGQTAMIFALADEPETMKKFFLKVVEAFLSVLGEQEKLVPAFHGGSCLGFYHVFCPGTSIWFKDDLSAIMSPEMYKGISGRAGATASAAATTIPRCTFIPLRSSSSTSSLPMRGSRRFRSTRT
jgi:hypothetical protein